MTNTPSLRIEGLTKSFGEVEAVSNLSMQVEAGEILCFLGPNGAGKTTTIHIIIGRKQPSAGDVFLHGVSLRSPRLDQVRRRVGYMPEHPLLYDYLTGREFIQFIGQLYGAGSGWNEWVNDRLDALQMHRDADRLIKGYSAGMKKKISFLAALAPRPDTLIFDEPTSALDAPSARVVKDEMTAARDRGSLVFFTTHVMELAERLADRIAIIDHGRLVTIGTLADIRAHHGRTSNESLESLFLRLVQNPRAKPSVSE